MRARVSYRAVILWVAAIAVSNTVTAHITRSGLLKPGQNNQSIARQNIPVSDVTAKLATSAPYRDGLFMAKINRQRGEFGQASVGRWSTAVDRAAFTAGYENAYKTASLSGN